ncbi:hypothetical protein K6U16_15175 [Vibrio parahaemolyticus]|uniref:hypothetical protein n=1 Tax=Vibrio parahaemolyticus TaxID=670 RepID=UPI001EEAF5E4|nr:hypothetical protein [Vibrio parahaemolyticus]EGQ8456751.1 hypothetical protein [Vibrio parahaemolyticus]EGQ8464356.1 hypothetical protein [Vibrio parahaemolyticus]EGQ9405943.1 hypothetical protein [Vibrio parahaemolyticus]EGR0297554.1 hypothetical protein [Vibrio parahaemolyticus]EGR3273417.1 hypothetical protein [Vibrio parahaemolyticus]
MPDFVKKTDVIGGERAQFDIDNDYRRYLAETDWYVIREQETGEAIPADVKANRAEARAAVQSPFTTTV